MSSSFLVPSFRHDDSAYTREQLTEIFIHEILHRFAGFHENNPGIREYWDAFRAEYADEPAVTQNHVVIYAFLEIILAELYGLQKLQDFIRPSSAGYVRAVAIVKEKGAQELAGQFRGFLR